MAATIVNAITAWRCSLCTPMAAAWMAPAPSDAAPTRANQPSAAEGGDGVGGMERLALLLPFDDDGHGGTPFPDLASVRATAGPVVVCPAQFAAADSGRR